MAWVARWGKSTSRSRSRTAAAERADRYNQALRRLVSAIIDDDGGDDDGNAPGHAQTPASGTTTTALANSANCARRGTTRAVLWDNLSMTH